MRRQTATVLKYISIIQRCTRRYFDLTLEKSGIASGQQFFLLRIYENPGMTMNDLSRSGSYDKGTVTKAVQKLAEEGYVEVKVDQADKRVRRLHPTPRAEAMVDELYRLRDRWVDELMDGLSPQERQLLFERMQAMAERACAALEPLCKEEKHDQASATD